MYNKDALRECVNWIQPAYIPTAHLAATLKYYCDHKTLSDCLTVMCVYILYRLYVPVLFPHGRHAGIILQNR